MEPQALTTITTQELTALQPLRVSIQGYAGAFHEIAARRFYGTRPLDIVPAHTFDDLVAQIEEGAVTDTGLMAIENTLAGSLMANYNLLNRSRLQVTGEVYLRIEQNLLTLPGVSIEELREVHSHPIAIAQCEKFFSRYPHIRLVETADTALSARHVFEQQDRTRGAIASTLAAELYELQVLAAGIETNKQNHTRFLILERGPYNGEHRPHANKVSLSFSVDHTVGSLHKVLAVLAAYNINLTKIQSAPIIGKPWEYLFYVDFVAAGHIGWEQALDAIRPLTHQLRVLGVYAQGRKPDEY